MKILESLLSKLGKAKTDLHKATLENLGSTLSTEWKLACLQREQELHCSSMEVKRLAKEVAFKDGLLGKARADGLQTQLLASDCLEFNQSQPKSVKTWKARNHKLASTGNLFKAPSQAPATHLDFFRIDAQDKPKTDGCHIFKSTKSRLAATSKAKNLSTNLDTHPSRTKTIKLETKLAKDGPLRDTPQRPPGPFADFDREQRSHSAPQRNSSDAKSQRQLCLAACIPQTLASDPQKHLAPKEACSHGSRA